MDDDKMKGKVVEKSDEFGEPVSEWQPARGVGAKVFAMVILVVLVAALVVGVLAVVFK